MIMYKFYLIIFLTLTLLLFKSNTLFGQISQTQAYHHSYTIVIPTNSIGEQKLNIDFLRNQFGSEKCDFNQTNSSYTLYLTHFIDTTALKNKITALGYPVSGNIIHKPLDTVADEKLNTSPN